MKKKEKPTYNGITFDSDEEREFFWWAEEAVSIGAIFAFKYHDFEPWVLSEKATMKVQKVLKTKIKIIDKFLFHPHQYTHDFEIDTGENNRFFNPIENRYVYIDVKGGFMDRGATQEFSINRKWMWQRHGIYIDKVVPKKFFKKTWVPEFARYTEKRKDLKECYLGFNTVDSKGL